MAQTRNRRVYKLPGEQRKLFALALEKNEFYLYDFEFGARLPPRYIVSSNGVLTNWFDEFPVWTIEDLVDTGEEY